MLITAFFMSYIGVSMCKNRSRGINRNCSTSNHNPSCSQSHVNIKECVY